MDIRTKIIIVVEYVIDKGHKGLMARALNRTEVEETHLKKEKDVDD